MLIIRRGCGESLFIGDDVEIEVLNISHSQVKLGIRAPKSIPVLRKEVLTTLEANRAASRTVLTGPLASVIEQIVNRKKAVIAKPAISTRH